MYYQMFTQLKISIHLYIPWLGSFHFVSWLFTKSKSADYNQILCCFFPNSTEYLDFKVSKIVVLSDPFWSYLILSDPVWSCLMLSGPFWSILVLSDPVWSYLILIVSYVMKLRFGTGQPNCQTKMKKIDPTVRQKWKKLRDVDIEARVRVPRA